LSHKSQFHKLISPSTDVNVDEILLFLLFYHLISITTISRESKWSEVGVVCALTFFQRKHEKIHEAHNFLSVSISSEAIVKQLRVSRLPHVFAIANHESLKRKTFHFLFMLWNAEIIITNLYVKDLIKRELMTQLYFSSREEIC
jgi:hypothetical protein